MHIWWALHTLEGSLSIVVGRPSSVDEAYYSTPLPLSLSLEQLSDEALASNSHEPSRGVSPHNDVSGPGSTTFEPSNVGSLLGGLARLSIIAQKAMVGLYSPKVMTRSWKSVQGTIADLDDELGTWAATLPSDLNFVQPNNNTTFMRERLILQMNHIRIKILITRPCLCRLDSRIQNQTTIPNDFNKRTARMCVNAAKAIIGIFPDHANAPFLYQTGPWWSIAHSLMQALTVLLLELSYGTVHFPEDGKEIVADIKILIRWLRKMKDTDQVAERAYKVAFGILQDLAPRMDVDISDLLHEDEVDSAFPAAPNPQDQFIGGHHSGFSFGESNMQAWQQTTQASGLYDTQMGHLPMFTYPPGSLLFPRPMESAGTQPIESGMPWLPFNNPFGAAHDEQNPLTLNDKFLT